MADKEPIILYIKKAKRHAFWRDVKKKCNNIFEWCKDHPQEAIVIGTAVVGLGTAAVKGVSKTINKHQQIKLTTELKDLYVYDRSLGHYWKLRKPLSNSQWLFINEKLKDGKKLGDILAEMRVLE